MCEPATLAAIGGAGISATSQWSAGQSQKAQADLNATIAKRAGDDAIMRGDIAANDIRLKGREVVGAATAAAGASGVDVRSGSVQDVIGATSMLSEADAQRTRLNAAREAWGYKSQAAGFSAQGAQAEQAAGYGAAGTFLGGLGSAAQYGGSAYRVDSRQKPPSDGSY